jgi:DNA-binding LacI/PurR family transcriptional regulator
MIELERKMPFVCLERAGQPDWITGSEADFYQIGMEAARLLIEKIIGQTGRDSPSRSVVLPDEWHEGTSHLG